METSNNNNNNNNNSYYYGASPFSSVRGPQADRGSTPIGGRFLQLTKAHGPTKTQNPALRREGHFTFVECRRRRIPVCAKFCDKE